MCNFWHPGTLTLRDERQSARMSKITKMTVDDLTLSYTGGFIAVAIGNSGLKGLMPYKADRVKPSFVIFDIGALRMSKITNGGRWLNPVCHRMLYSCSHAMDAVSCIRPLYATSRSRDGDVTGRGEGLTWRKKRWDVLVVHLQDEPLNVGVSAHFEPDAAGKMQLRCIHRPRVDDAVASLADRGCVELLWRRMHLATVPVVQRFTENVCNNKAKKNEKVTFLDLKNT